MPFDRELLPHPEDYYGYQAALDKYKPKANGKATACCPFHDDKHPSLGINLETGAYRCYSCGEGGGDVLAFHMSRNNYTFKEACEDLGAWK